MYEPPSLACFAAKMMLARLRMRPTPAIVSAKGCAVNPKRSGVRHLIGSASAMLHSKEAELRRAASMLRYASAGVLFTLTSSADC